MSDYFLRVISKKAKELESGFDSSGFIKHNASKGAVREYLVNKCLRPFLPQAYGIASAECFDYEDRFSKQMDIIVYDQIYSYVVPFTENFMQIPYESVYGGIEVKTMLDSKELKLAIDNLASMKKLKRIAPKGVSITPNCNLDIEGVNWNINTELNLTYGIVFAFRSCAIDTLMEHLQKYDCIGRHLLPDMIVLFDQRMIIFKALFEDTPKFGLYPKMNGCPEGYVAVKCEDSTLSIFISSVLSYTSNERLVRMQIENMLNAAIDDILRNGQDMKWIRYAENC